MNCCQNSQHPWLLKQWHLFSMEIDSLNEKKINKDILVVESINKTFWNDRHLCISVQNYLI